MNRLATFFQGAEHGIGGFYPNQHIVAVYPTAAAADQAKKMVDSSAKTIAVSGSEVLDFVGDHVVETGLLGGLMRELSSWLGTEEQYVEKDIEAAQKGAGFVAVYCPDEQSKAKVWSLLESTHPLVGRFYSSGGIEHLT